MFWSYYFDMKIISFFCLFCVSLLLSIEGKESLSVVIIGGGPAGLATAIEAGQAGASVTVVEKRASYSRGQRVFLCDDALRRLEGWRVVCPQMMAFSMDGTSCAIVRINDLEESLVRRVNEMGIKILRGEFKNFADESKVMIATADGETYVTYDLLIGADGTHSSVRKALNIQVHKYGEAVGASAVLLLQSPIEKISVDTNESETLFVGRMKAPPSMCIVFAQSAPGTFDKILPLQFVQALEDANWREEAQIVQEEKMQYFMDRIRIVLQQATNFSDPSKRVILVGDSAATASFFEGMGVNTAFRTVTLAGAFIKNVQDYEANAYTIFNEAMQVTTGELINGSLYLFERRDLSSGGQGIHFQ